jgi:hypothetical protein
MLLTPVIQTWVLARATGSPYHLAPSPQQEPRHALANAKLLKILGSAEPTTGRYGLNFGAGASNSASHSAGVVHHYQPNSIPAMHFLAADAPGSNLVSRLYSMGSTPFSTPPMPKKALFAESPQTEAQKTKSAAFGHLPGPSPSWDHAPQSQMP